MEWFVYSIASVIMFSLMTGLYKLPAYKYQSRLATTLWMMVFIFLFALLAFNKAALLADGRAVVYSALWGASFATLTAIQIYLLKDLKISTLFPINTMLSMIFVVAFGLLFFLEKISLVQGAGVLVALIALYFFLFEKQKVRYSPQILKLGLLMVSLSVITKVLQKINIDAIVDIQILLIYQFMFAAITLLIAGAIYHRSSWRTKILSRSAKSGLLIAIPAFVGNWAIMSALSKGPFTLIYAIHSLYIFGGAIIGYFFFKEQLTKRKILLLSMAIIAAILIRLG